jgi:transmembrane sensor
MDANSRRARAVAEAAEWWVRIESDELSREEREQFVDWLRESAVHVAEMLRMAEVHGALERFPDWLRVPTKEGAQVASNVVAFDGPRAAANPTAFDDERAAAGPIAFGDARAATDPSPGQPARYAPRAFSQPHSMRRRWIAGLALAATVAVLGVFLTFFFSAQVIETGRAERRSVTLADGSVVQVDPESRLRIRLQKRQRDVSLERGRALFRVAKDPSRPFVVRAEATQVRAVGTQFGVEQAREGIVVTVAEGKVAVLPHEPSDDRNNSGVSAPPAGHPATERGATTAEVLLTAGQQVIVPRRGPAKAVRAVDTDRELAWVAGRLVFDNESVADVVEEFNRYNVVQLHVASPRLAQRSVSGVFDASEPESFIGFMQSVVPVNVRRAGQDITIALAP